MRTNILKNPIRCIALLVGAFFPASIVTMVAFFNVETFVYMPCFLYQIAND